MTAAERERFHNLLLMAKESPFEGERSNALEAAERMAKRNGLTLEEAARSGGEAMQQAPSARQQSRSTFEQAEAEATARERAFSEMAQFMRNAEMRARSDRARHDEALKAAYERGLDAAERRQQQARLPRARDDESGRRHDGERDLLRQRRGVLDGEPHAQRFADARRRRRVERGAQRARAQRASCRPSCRSSLC